VRQFACYAFLIGVEMDRRLMSALVAVLALVQSPCVQAGNSNGPVTKIYAHANDIVIFAAGTHNEQPACSGNEWALSLTTPTGKAMYALLLLAYAQGKPVSVVGTSACTAWPDRETPVYITLDQ
jgi:hypothetical protein